jgi:protein phosphatase
VSKLLVGSATDVGLVRSNNQDQFLVAPGLYAVADGMGGHAAGEVASATAIKALQAAFAAGQDHSAGSLETAAKAANRAVWEQARTNRGMLGMGTTLVALAVVEHDDGTNGLAVAHIGDSRLYLFRDGSLRQVTVDHSLVQELVDDGQISEAQAAVHPHRHVLTRALGVEPAVEVDLINLVPKHGDRYLLCSDGLPREAADEQIASVLRRYPDPSEAAKELVSLAISRGGSDNVTAVVVDVLASEGSPETLIVVPGPPASARPSRRPPVAPQAPGSTARPAPGARTRTSPNWLTLRAIGFVAALCFVIGGAIACLGWYGRSAYFVAFSQEKIAIFQGRPGGVLWFQPTLVKRTPYGRQAVEQYNWQRLATGEVVASVADAEQYIDNLVSTKREAEAVTPPSAKGPPHRHRTPKAPPKPSTTAKPSTTVSKDKGRAKKSPPVTSTS